MVKLRTQHVSTDSDNNSVGSKSFEEKYANQLQIGETYQVEYDGNNLQGALIVNSDGLPMSGTQSNILYRICSKYRAIEIKTNWLIFSLGFQVSPAPTIQLYRRPARSLSIR